MIPIPAAFNASVATYGADGGGGDARQHRKRGGSVSKKKRRKKISERWKDKSFRMRMLNAEAGVTDFRGMPELASNLVFGFNNAVDGAATFDRLLTPLSSLLN